MIFRGLSSRQAALVLTGLNVPFCGGSLLNTFYVVTSAQCVNNRAIATFEVILGKHLTAANSGNDLRLTAQRVSFPHRENVVGDAGVLLCPIAQPKLQPLNLHLNDVRVVPPPPSNGGQAPSPNGPVRRWGRGFALPPAICQTIGPIFDPKTAIDSPGHEPSECTMKCYLNVTDDVTGQVKGQIV